MFVSSTDRFNIMSGNLYIDSQANSLRRMMIGNKDWDFQSRARDSINRYVGRSVGASQLAFMVFKGETRIATPESCPIILLGFLAAVPKGSIICAFTHMGDFLLHLLLLLLLPLLLRPLPPPLAPKPKF